MGNEARRWGSFFYIGSFLYLTSLVRFGEKSQPIMFSPYQLPKGLPEKKDSIERYPIKNNARERTMEVFSFCCCLS